MYTGPTELWSELGWVPGIQRRAFECDAFERESFRREALQRWTPFRADQ